MLDILTNIRQQPAVLDTIARHSRGEGEVVWADCAEVLCNRSRVAFVAMGGSRNAAMPAALYLNEAGIESYVLDASELLYYGRVPSDTALVLVSRSGRTAEVVRMAEKLRQASLPFVAVTHEQASPITEGARAIVHIPCESDDGISPRMYTSTLLTLLYMSARTVGHFESFDRQVQAMLLKLAPMIPEWERVQTDLSSSDYFCFLGRGYSLGTASESALLFQELARRPSAAFAAAEFRQGPIEVIRPAHTVFIFAPEGRTRDLSVALINEVRATQAKVIEIGSPWPELPEYLATVTQIIPVQIAAHDIAVRAKQRPGEFRFAALTTESEPGGTEPK